VRPMNWNRRTLLLCLGAAACASSRAEPSLDHILARHTESRGGATALDAVRNTLNVALVTEPTFQVVGRYIASAEGFMRIDVFHEGRRAVSEGIDAEGDWDWAGGAAEAQPASAVARASGALAHGIEFNLFGLHAMTRRGHALMLEGRETIGGVDYYKIKLRLSDGFETWRYINPNTWLVDRNRDFRALHPDTDPTPEWIETEFGDQRSVSGVLTPFTWIQRRVQTGEELQRGAIERLAYNVAADQLNFPRRAAVIAP
jgi:hypothetical protein